jgi:hypothetical protein
MATNDIDIMLGALKKEREQAHQKVMQLDRIIKNIKEGKYSDNSTEDLEGNNASNKQPVVLNQSFKTADIRVQVLQVFDTIKKASKLQVIQDEYNRLTETRYNIRDTVRSLQRSQKLKMVKEIGASRGFLWIRAEWMENGQILDQYKPEGFDMLYKPENLEYE